MRYGVDQCIGDTIGPGGIFKALRTGPAWLDIVSDVQRIAPKAAILNYTNPMSILTLAALRTVDLPVVGLCHSVQGTSRQLADYLGIDYADMTWECAGINHNAWFTKLELAGEDMYPRLRDHARLPEIYEQDPVRFEVMLDLGAFVTESSGHFSEYVPYFRKRPDLIQRYTRNTRAPDTWAKAASTPTTGRAGDARMTSRSRRCCVGTSPCLWRAASSTARTSSKRSNAAAPPASTAMCSTTARSTTFPKAAWRLSVASIAMASRRSTSGRCLNSSPRSTAPTWPCMS